MIICLTSLSLLHDNGDELVWTNKKVSCHLRWIVVFGFISIWILLIWFCSKQTIDAIYHLWKCLTGRAVITLASSITLTSSVMYMRECFRLTTATICFWNHAVLRHLMSMTLLIKYIYHFHWKAFICRQTDKKFGIAKSFACKCRQIVIWLFNSYTICLQWHTLEHWK